MGLRLAPPLLTVMFYIGSGHGVNEPRRRLFYEVLLRPQKTDSWQKSQLSSLAAVHACTVSRIIMLIRLRDMTFRTPPYEIIFSLDGQAGASTM